MKLHMTMQILGSATPQLVADCGSVTHTILCIDFFEYPGRWRIRSEYKAYIDDEFVATTGPLDVDYSKTDGAKALTAYRDAVSAALMDATANLLNPHHASTQPQFSVNDPTTGRLRN